MDDYYVYKIFYGKHEDGTVDFNTVTKIVPEGSWYKIVPYLPKGYTFHLENNCVVHPPEIKELITSEDLINPTKETVKAVGQALEAFLKNDIFSFDKDPLLNTSLYKKAFGNKKNDEPKALWELTE